MVRFGLSALTIDKGPHKLKHKHLIFRLSLSYINIEIILNKNKITKNKK